MGRDRPTLFEVTTPVPGFETVTLYEDSWSFHIVPGHPELASELLKVQQVVSEPQFVFSGSTTTNFLFLDPVVTNTQGHPLIVAVGQERADVKTAYFKKAFKGFNEGTIPSGAKVIWRPK